MLPAGRSHFFPGQIAAVLFMNFLPVISLAVLIAVREKVTPRTALEFLGLFGSFGHLAPPFPHTVEAFVGRRETLPGDERRHRK